MIQVFGSKHDNEITSFLKESIENSWLGCGPKVKEFEKLFSDRIKKPFVMVSNGSNALHLAVKLLNLPKKSRILVPSFTFVACTQAVLLEGHIPVLCDVEKNGNISINTINQHLSKVQAIMVVHYGGRPVNINPIIQTKLPVIEDAAHAVDSAIDGKMCGTFGELGVYSFDPIKNISTPDSGGIALNNKTKTKAEKLRHLGLSSTGLASFKTKWWEQDIIDVFPKYLPNDIAATFAISQLKKLSQNQERRKQIWNFYQKELTKFSWIEKEEEVPKNIKHSYFTYLIKIKKNRNKFASYLKENGIYTTLRFHPLHLIKLFSRYAKIELPNCERLNKTGLNLPLHPNLDDNSLDKIIDRINNWNKYT